MQNNSKLSSLEKEEIGQIETIVSSYKFKLSSHKNTLINDNQEKNTNDVIDNELNKKNTIMNNIINDFNKDIAKFTPKTSIAKQFIYYIKLLINYNKKDILTEKIWLKEIQRKFNNSMKFFDHNQKKIEKEPSPKSTLTPQPRRN